MHALSSFQRTKDAVRVPRRRVIHSLDFAPALFRGTLRAYDGRSFSVNPFFRMPDCDHSESACDAWQRASEELERHDVLDRETSRRACLSNVCDLSGLSTLEVEPVRAVRESAHDRITRARAGPSAAPDAARQSHRLMVIAPSLVGDPPVVHVDAALLDRAAPPRPSTPRGPPSRRARSPPARASNAARGTSIDGTSSNTISMSSPDRHRPASRRRARPTRARRAPARRRRAPARVTSRASVALRLARCGRRRHARARARRSPARSSQVKNFR